MFSGKATMQRPFSGRTGSDSHGGAKLEKALPFLDVPGGLA
jgi:hypothetical protein